MGCLRLRYHTDGASELFLSVRTTIVTCSLCLCVRVCGGVIVLASQKGMQTHFTGKVRTFIVKSGLLYGPHNFKRVRVRL